MKLRICNWVINQADFCDQANFDIFIDIGINEKEGANQKVFSTKKLTDKIALVVCLL